MSKNLPTQKIGEPTHRYLRFILDHNASLGFANNDSHYIDIAAALGAMNRRAYRQGLYYYVSGVTVHDSNQNVWTKFATAPDNWCVKQSWIRGFRKWSEMNSRVAAALGADDLEIDGKWADFKIWLNDNHYNNDDGGNGNMLLPVGSRDYEGLAIDTEGLWTTFVTTGAQFFPVGEWQKSKYHSMQDGDEQRIHLLGDHVTGTSYSLTKGYSETRRTVLAEDPVLPAEINTDYLQTLFDDEDDTVNDVVQWLEDDNDSAPYPTTIYPINDTCVVAQTANSAGAGAVTRTPGFVVPFGLLEVITNSPTDGKVEIVIEVAAGDYNGVAAARVC